MKNVVIVAAQRSAIGSFLGSLSSLSAADIAAQVIKDCLDKTGLDTKQIDEVLLGQVYTAGTGPNPARQASLAAGLPISCPATTVNMVCGSGLRSIDLAAQSIRSGQADCIIAGGSECMSQAPHLLPDYRQGKKMGPSKIIDSLIHDALWDASYDCHMGMTAENLAEEYTISREEQDAFALLSQNRAAAAQKAGHFINEISPVEIKTRKKGLTFDKDEYPRADSSREKLADLRPAFKENGSVSAGNASGINDGAAIVILMSQQRAHELNMPILAQIGDSSLAGVDPRRMGIGPAEAIKTLLSKNNKNISDYDCFEINEAFASQIIAVEKELGLNHEQINPNGGAIALGHPVGASGARILVTLLHHMQRNNLKQGIASLCIGGGMGIALEVTK